MAPARNTEISGQGLLAAQPGDPPESFWRSLSFFNAYRLIVAGLFLFTVHYFNTTLDFGYQNPGGFQQISLAYLLLGAGFVLLRHSRWAFSWQLSLQVITDILILTLLMHFSGGSRSGLAFMMLVVLAGAGLVGQGRLSLFFAALATLAVLAEQSVRVLRMGADQSDFAQSGIICIGFFATAISARMLARRAIANERLAQERGRELAEQMSLNEQVIRDMEDGVLIVDARGLASQTNPSARRLLGLTEKSADLSAAAPLAELSAPLGEAYRQWQQQGAKESRSGQIIPLSAGRSLRLRFMPAGESGHALIYLEDTHRLLEQAQQIKLAALGRLTANMAHEIRNPLAAISHAAELLAEEQRDTTRQRLTRIIGDNTQRLNRLVAEVLELGRRDRALPEELHLKTFLQTFLDEYAIQDPRVTGIVHWEAADDLVLYFDRSHLNRVLTNLLGNALRHGGEASGEIHIRAHAADGGRTELHVTDHGAGIEKSVEPQIFEPFFTTHGQGTGLGLYIARELCEANGAELQFRGNTPGAHFCLAGQGGAHA